MIETFLAQLLNGLIMGSIYALIAMGISLIFGVVNTLNFAHGDFYMLGAYVSFWLISSLSINHVLALVISMTIVGILGFLFYQSFVFPVVKRGIKLTFEYILISTLALSLFLQNAVLIIFGPFPRRTPSFLPVIRFDFMVIQGDRLFAGFVGILIMVFLIALVSKTLIGKALQAVAQDRVGAASLGINPYQMDALAFSLSVALAAAAGMLLSSSFFIFPEMGNRVILKGIAIVILGGLGSLKGSIIGAYILGLIEVLAIAFLPTPSALLYRDLYSFIVLIGMLLFRPHGIAGER